MRIQSPSWAAGQGEPRTRNWHILASPATYEQSVLNEQIQSQACIECRLPGLTLIMPMGSVFTALTFGSSWTCIKFYLLKCCNQTIIVQLLGFFFHSPFNFVPTEVPHSISPRSLNCNRIWEFLHLSLPLLYGIVSQKGSL